MLIDVEAVQSNLGCPHCGVINPKLYRHGGKKVEVFDLPIRNKRVKLRLNLRRFRCRECGKTHIEKHDGVEDRRRMTSRLIEFIRHEGMIRTFTNVAESIGCTEGTVRMIVNEHVAELEHTYRFETPEFLGIDEIHIHGKPRGVFTNVKERTVVELTANRHSPTMKSVLERMDADVVEGVTSDMWKAYHKIVREVFPKATMVVDKFHIVRMANLALDQVRKHVGSQNKVQKKDLMRKRWCLLKRPHDLDGRQKKDLKMLTEKYSDLKVAYDLKEQFYGIYDAPNKQDARARVADWLYAVPKEMEPYFKDLITSTINFQESILNFWDCPITNALTESLNRNIRTLTRDARGYSFRILRAKLLFSGGHKIKTKTSWSGAGFSRYMPPSKIDYGIPISTFMDMVQEMNEKSDSTR
jgi:transposase